MVFSTYLMGVSANAIAVDLDGRACLTGTTYILPVTANAFQISGRGTKAFVARFNQLGTDLQYASYLGGINDELGSAIGLDSAGNVYVAGTTRSFDFPITPGALQTVAPAGEYKGFVVKVADTPIPPRPQITKIVNAASGDERSIAPGALVSIIGTGLAPSTMEFPVPLPLSAGGVSVSIGGRFAPLLYVSPTQINAQVPFEVPMGDFFLVVDLRGLLSSFTAVRVNDTGPGIFRVPGTKTAIAQNEDLTLNAPNNPALAGSVITVYFTGQGAVDNPVPSGAAAPLTPLSRAVAPVRAFIARDNSQLLVNETGVLFAGLTPGLVGVAQANVRLPKVSPGEYLLYLVAAGTGEVVTISIG